MSTARHHRNAARLHPSRLLLLAGVVAVLVAAWQVNGQRPGLRLPDRQDAGEGRTFITTDAVNLRAGPSTGDGVLTVLDAGTPVTVTGAARQGFLPVRVDGQEAWIAADFLLAKTESAAGAVPATDALTRAGFVETAHAAPAEPEADVAAGTDAETGIEAVTDPPAEPATVAENVAMAPAEAEAEVVEVRADEVAPAPSAPPEGSVPAAPGERWVEVDRSTAQVTLHEGDRVVATYQGKIGKDPSADGYFSTAIGTFYVYSMNKELTETPFVEGVYLTDWVGFDPGRSNGFHSPVRDAAGNVVNTQGATTLGCVRLAADAAEALFDFAFIGMRVEVHD